jgi:hypothetical protein
VFLNLGILWGWEKMKENLVESRLFRIKTNFDQLVIKQVTEIEDLLQSSQLLYTNYHKRGYLKQGKPFLYLPQYCDSPNFLFTAKEGDDIVGTIGIIQDENLPAYGAYRQDIDALKIGAGKRIELSSLAIREDYQNQNLFYDLYSSAVLFAIFKVRAQHIFIQVDSKKASFYERLFFKKIGENQVLEAYNGVTSSLLYMDVERAWKLVRRRCQGQSNTAVVMNMLKMFGVYDRYKVLSPVQLRNMAQDWSANDLHYYQEACGQV